MLSEQDSYLFFKRFTEFSKTCGFSSLSPPSSLTPQPVPISGIDQLFCKPSAFPTIHLTLSGSAASPGTMPCSPQGCPAGGLGHGRDRKPQWGGQTSASTLSLGPQAHLHGGHVSTQRELDSISGPSPRHWEQSSRRESFLPSFLPAFLLFPLSLSFIFFFLMEGIIAS